LFFPWKEIEKIISITGKNERNKILDSKQYLSKKSSKSKKRQVFRYHDHKHWNSLKYIFIWSSFSSLLLVFNAKKGSLFLMNNRTTKEIMTGRGRPIGRSCSDWDFANITNIFSLFSYRSTTNKIIYIYRPIPLYILFVFYSCFKIEILWICFFSYF